MQQPTNSPSDNPSAPRSVLVVLQDPAAQVIMNLCAMVERNGGEFVLPPQVVKELSGGIGREPDIQDSQARLDAQEEA